MADNVAQTSMPRPAPQRVDTLPASSSSSNPNPSQHKLGLTLASPVNQNGSFEFDRVLKAGPVLKRTRKTKARSLPAHLRLPS